MVSVKSHLELSTKYLNEGKSLIDKDPIQASEKLYKAAEEQINVKKWTKHYLKLLELKIL
jgi:hypothetical protein